MKKCIYEGERLHRVEYYRDGKLHREDGPAVIVYDCCGAHVEEKFYEDGVEIKKDCLLFDIV